MVTCSAGRITLCGICRLISHLQTWGIICLKSLCFCQGTLNFPTIESQHSDCFHATERFTAVNTVALSSSSSSVCVGACGGSVSVSVATSLRRRRWRTEAEKRTQTTWRWSACSNSTPIRWCTSSNLKTTCTDALRCWEPNR